MRLARLVAALFARFVMGLAVAWFLTTPIFAQSETAQSAPQEKKKVIVGFYVNDIQGIDLPGLKHTSDLYVWFRAKDKSYDPFAMSEYMNMADPSSHVNNKLSIASPMADGTFYTSARHIGSFTSKFSLQDFPFDKQELIVDIEDSETDSSTFDFAIESEPVRLASDITLTGYTLGTPRTQVANHTYPTTFGDPTASTGWSYSRIRLTIPIYRQGLSGFLKYILPILMVVMSAMLGLLLKPDRVSERVGLAITGLLTLVALQLSTSKDLPDLDYLTILDKVYIMSILSILVLLAAIVRSSWKLEIGGEATEAATDRRILLLLLLIYALASGFIFLPAFR